MRTRAGVQTLIVILDNHKLSAKLYATSKTAIAAGPVVLHRLAHHTGEPKVQIHLPPAERWYGAGGEEMAPSSL